LTDVAALSEHGTGHDVREVPDFCSGAYGTAFVNDCSFVCKKISH
jgi:hypothetical protein